MTILLQTACETCPSAYAQMLEFFCLSEMVGNPNRLFAKTDDGDDLEELQWDDRLLFNFFDDLGIFAEVSKKTLWEWRLGPFESDDDNHTGGYQTRQEAETAVFLECFKLLETD